MPGTTIDIQAQLVGSDDAVVLVLHHDKGASTYALMPNGTFTPMDRSSELAMRDLVGDLAWLDDVGRGQA